MGLDWNPGPKAKPGLEGEFAGLWNELHQKPCFFRERKVERFKEITVGAFETIAAPRVGFDERANEWVKAQYPRRVDKSITEEDWVRRYAGFYVVELVPKCDGLPRFTNGAAGGYVELFSFRGEFLKDCREIIDDELLDSAWISKLPRDTDVYGAQLIDRATAYAQKEQIDPDTAASVRDPDRKEFHYDVVMSAGRWCRFWAQRGHWLEAYF